MKKRVNHAEIRNISGRIFVIIGIIFLEGIIISLLSYSVHSMGKSHTDSIINDNNISDKINNDMHFFPVPIDYQSEVIFEDSFGAYRNNGNHEGCDIMDVYNNPGRIPIISSTDGTITNMGWLYLGGYRMGITSDNNIYYYYAHLDSYAAGLEVGDKVCAGQFLGFMGDSGEGDEGTRGKFPVHLHFGIYAGMTEGQEQAIDSYPFLISVLSNR